MLSAFNFARLISIRPANINDQQFVTESIRELVKVGENLDKMPRIEGIEQTYEKMIEDTKHYAIYIAEDQNQKIGAAVLSIHDALHIGGKYAYLEEFVISSSARGTGVGSKFLKWIEKEAQQKGLVAISLCQPPTTSQYNEERSRFYEKNGYLDQSISRVKFFKPWFKVD